MSRYTRYPGRGLGKGGKGWRMRRFARTYRRRKKAGTLPGYTRKVGYYGRYNKGPGESKFHDIVVVDGVVSGNGDIQNTGSVNLIAQGTTESERIGRKCTINSIGFRYVVSLPRLLASATPTESDIVRVIVYVDKQCNGLAAAVTDILESTIFFSYRNLSNSSRFTILCDKNHTINYPTFTSTQNADTFDAQGVSRYYSFFKKVNIPIEYNSTTGAITEIRTNNIGVLLISANGVAGFTGTIRLRFTG